MTRPRARCQGRRGFSLVEILVTAAILFLIGGLAAGLMLSSFRIWQRCAEAARGEAADDAWVPLLARDFAAGLPGRGFTGDAAGCRFWTFTGAPERAVLREVAYHAEAGLLLRRLQPLPDAPGSEERFALVGTLHFSYGSTLTNALTWAPAWRESTNAPARLLLLRATPDGAARETLLLRRTP
jgi:hypothetical protein